MKKFLGNARARVALGLVVASMAAASMADAQGVSAIDVSAVTAGVGNQLGSVTGVGVAIFAIVVAIAAIKWVRRVIR